MALTEQELNEILLGVDLSLESNTTSESTPSPLNYTSTTPQALNPFSNDTGTPYMELFRMGLYITEGVLLVIFNGLLLTTILRHKALRVLKEFIVLGGLAFSDALSGLGTFFAGVHRVPLLLSHTTHLPASRSDCFLKLHNIFWVYGVPAQGFMLLIVSLDRLFAVWAPRAYVNYQQHALEVVLGVYLALAVQYAVLAVRSLPLTKQDVFIYCYERFSVQPIDYTIYYNTAVGAALMSICVYAAVIVIYKRRFNRIAVKKDSKATDWRQEWIMNDELKRQREFTTAASISCFCTLVFYAIPRTSMMLSAVFPFLDYGLISVWAVIISNINPMLNLFIFFKKQKEFRIGVKALLMNKTMPPNIRMWSDKFTIAAIFEVDADDI